MWKFALLVILKILMMLVYWWPNTEVLFGFDIQLNYHQTKLPDSFRGALLANNWLSTSEHLFVDEIRGPESFATWNGKTYTSIADGRIIELLEDDFRTVAFLNPNDHDLESCRKSFFAAKHCARPLGLRFSRNGTLYAVDPYHGVFQINVDNGHYRLVMDIKQTLFDNSTARFLDDLSLMEDGQNDGDDMTIFLTDASQRWSLHDVFYTVGEHDQTGRLLSFDVGTSHSKVLLDQLAFPNGLAMMDNKSVILINEFNKRRILAYHISGEKQGQLNVFVDQLPGEPDNIKRSLNQDRETYWVGLFHGRNKHRPSFTLDIMADKPMLRRFYFRILRATGYIIESIGNLLQQDQITEFGHYLRVGECMFSLVSEYGLGIEIDSKGNIVDSLHSPDGRTSQLAEVFEYQTNENERSFYLGSYSNRYLGRLVVPKRRHKQQSRHKDASESRTTMSVDTKLPTNNNNDKTTITTTPVIINSDDNNDKKNKKKAKTSHQRHEEL